MLKISKAEGGYRCTGGETINFLQTVPEAVDQVLWAIDEAEDVAGGLDVLQRAIEGIQEKNNGELDEGFVSGLRVVLRGFERILSRNRLSIQTELEVLRRYVEDNEKV
ncbi:MAG TPA: hypothetical protein PLI53_02475 [Geobacteraceae bacterium]|nr:hypothetical protein [Geobacteraceae bacterium]